MYVLVQNYLGELSVLDYGLSFTDCKSAQVIQTVIADHMATFQCILVPGVHF